MAEPAFGLPVELVARIHAELAAHPGVTRAHFCGSRAKGNFRPGSDIDLALEGDDLGQADPPRIAAVLDDLDLPWKIDLSLLAQIDTPERLEHIRRVGRAFHEQPALISLEARP